LKEKVKIKEIQKNYTKSWDKDVDYEKDLVYIDIKKKRIVIAKDWKSKNIVRIILNKVSKKFLDSYKNLLDTIKK
jgi:hypothetical protein